jgi:tetratricopeptide (TPR) repeat protein
VIVLAATILAAFVLLAPALAAVPQGGNAVPSARADLEVQLPRLEGLEPAVAEHLDAAHRDLAAAVQSGRRGRELGAAYGSLAEVLHAYEFFEPAETAYLEASRLAPGEPKWRHLLGYLYQQTGRWEDAARVFPAVRGAQHRQQAIARLGEVFLRMNRLLEAREQFEAIADTFPAVARNGLGEVALRQGRYSEALEHFRAALDLAPRATSIHYSLAMAHRALGRLDEARAHLEQRGAGGLRIVDPVVDRLATLVRGERLLVFQASRAYEAGQFEAAADAFTRALAAAPGSAAAHAGLGILLAREGRDPEAVDHLRAAFAQAPDDRSIRTALLGVLLRLGRHDEAIDALGAASSVDPDDEDLVVGLAILLAGRARYGDAVALLEAANRRFPDRSPTATTLARLLASSPERAVRDGPRALELAGAVYAASPTPAHAETMALALAELGRCAEARAWMQRAVAGAERAQDAEEAARLRAELAAYDADPCRR